MALNKKDLNQFKKIIKDQLTTQEKRIDARFLNQETRFYSKLINQKEEILDEIDNKLQNLKSDIYKRIDPVLKEVTTAKEERPLITNKIIKHEKRIEKLEAIHPSGSHISSS